MLMPTPSPFDDALAGLRVSGGVLLYERYSPPWAILIPNESELRRMLGVGADLRILPFHFVLEGEFDLTRSGKAPERILKGEVAICTCGDSHLMSAGDVHRPTPFSAVFAGEGPKFAPAFESASTKLLCGIFLLKSSPLNPLLSALPPLLKIRTTGVSESPMLMRASEMLTLEVGHGGSSSYTTARLIEVFCAEAIAAYRRGQGSQHPGWFRGLQDKKIGKAIAELHRNPGASWTVELLADTVAMSPSRFAARFRETTGQSVMSYVAGWRMDTACRLLRESDASLADIAQRIGYQDVAAFSRAFKALVGMSPSNWRGGR